MKKNRLLIALVVLIGASALAITAARSRQSDTSVEQPEATLPTLKKEDVTVVEIKRPGQEVITLAKKGEEWGVTAPLSAKADKSAVDSVIDKLSSLEVTGVAATRKESQARLQVDPEKAIRVTAKAGNKVLSDLFIGMSKSGSTMVRAEGKDQTMSVRGSIRYAFDKELKMFRDRVITDIDTADLGQMVIESEKGKFSFDKPDTAWKQSDGEKRIKDFADSKVQSLASTLSRLRAADFAEPGIDASKAGFDAPLAKVTLKKKNAGPVILELGGKANEGEHYLRVSGNDVIYRISKSTAERMMAESGAFIAEPKKEGEEEPAPPAMPMGGGPGMNQLPPELMEQLQRQMANQPHP